MPLSRKDWLLLFLYLPEERFRTDQLRTTKGMFLFSRQCPGVNNYDFEPYDYGPFSRDLYRDLDRLDAEGQIRRFNISASNRQIFETTSKGSVLARQLLQDAPSPEAELLTSIKRKVTALNFTDLLSAIYSQYPEYATRSKARV